MISAKPTSRIQGFTMIELMIAIFLLAVGMIGTYSMFSKNTKAHVSQEVTLELTQDLRASLNLMTTEIRMAGYDPTDVGGIGFLDDGDDKYDSDGNSIHFTMDLNDDGDATDTEEEINYFVDGSGNLMRRIDGATTPTEALVADNITALTFTYLDGSNAATATLADIRSVGISLTGQTRIVDPMTNNFKTRTETALIKVRNMGL